MGNHSPNVYLDTATLDYETRGKKKYYTLSITHLFIFPRLLFSDSVAMLVFND